MGWFFQRKPSPAPIPADLATQHRWLDQLHWHTTRHLHGMRQGQHASLLRGQGLDLADLREYQTTDDVRHIDWNVTARLQHTHVRVLHEDRDLAAWFIVDASASNAFGSTGRSKHDSAMGYVGILARLLIRQGNRVGAIVHTGQPGPQRMAVLAPKAGPQQLWRLTQVLREQPASVANGQQTNLALMLREAAQLVRSRSAVFVLSDFISQPGWAEALGQLAQRHDVVAVHLIDPMQQHLPDVGLLPMRDPETGEQLWVDTANPRLRARHAQRVAEQEAATTQAFVRAGVDVLELTTNEDLPLAVIRQLRMRQSPARAPLLSTQKASHV